MSLWVVVQNAQMVSSMEQDAMATRKTRNGDKTSLQASHPRLILLADIAKRDVAPVRQVYGHTSAADARSRDWPGHTHALRLTVLTARGRNRAQHVRRSRWRSDGRRW